jgi:hypothetical protein
MARRGRYGAEKRQKELKKKKKREEKLERKRTKKLDGAPDEVEAGNGEESDDVSEAPEPGEEPGEVQK